MICTIESGRSLVSDHLDFEAWLPDSAQAKYTRVRRDIIVIGGSAGSIDPLKRAIGAVPADLPASVFVVVHIPAWRRSELPEILTERLIGQAEVKPQQAREIRNILARQEPFRAE